MKNTALFLSVIFLFIACSCNGSSNRQKKFSGKLIENPEHHVKNAPTITHLDSTILYTGWYYIVDTGNGLKRQLDKSSDTYFIDPRPILTAKNFTTFEIYESNKGAEKYIGLKILLDAEGTKNWAIATEKSIGKRLAFVFDNRLIEVPKVQSQITGGVTAINRNEYTKEELENFKIIIESEK